MRLIAPEKAGLPADLPHRLDALVRRGGAPALHGVVVARRGRIVLEWYGGGEDHMLNTPLGHVHFGPDTLHDLRSVTKSLVALLYGLALESGLVPEPGEPLLSLFPEYAGLAADPRRAGLTIGHALTMTMGLEWDESAPYTSPENSEIAMELAPDRCRYVLERPFVEEPGEQWRYSGGAAALAGAIVEKGTGLRLQEFARTALFEPLGAGPFEWSAGSDGSALAASGLRLTPRGLARIGQAILNREIAPGWIGEMLRPRVPAWEGVSYGYLWYVGRDGRATAMGNGGQRLFLLPDLDLVVVVTAGAYDEAGQDTAPRAVLEDVVLAAIRGDAR
ncbi:serine hydrolase domain-containing protein [Microbispora hainanensis]|uniref:Serine hydrolase n=1 Tax=Microbispora hainanensis TaxID=568844 RepID=A0A544Z1U2_9ACTN|nr:serine hydrolase [Microbispora hainanensis]TQS22988.1 serine hydrolase [Microbispora hainanensis]